MSDWSAGYVSDIDYTYGYYDDLNPARIKLAFLKAGLVAPPITTACELGFGQGMSVNIHAVAGTTQWYGTDFNPAQAAFAKELAAVSGSGAALDDQSFEEFCNRQDLPDFDYIALHGIWTWISDSNRAVLVDFVRRKLKVGGVVYISYNTLPGWSAFIPLRNLMDEHIRQQGQAQPLGERIRAALAFAQGLLDLNPIYARAHPSIAERLKKLTEQSPEYLAHEYFNRDWHPMDFLKMNDWLEPAKLSYACSATYSEHVNGLTPQPRASHFSQHHPESPAARKHP